MNKLFLITSAAMITINISTALAAKCISNGTNTTGGTIEGTTTACTSCGLNCNWELDGGVLTISASTNPSTGKPYEVTMKDYSPFSAPWNSFRDNITSVNVGDGITSIGQNAFLRATNLTTVTLPDTLTSIKSNAFESATSLSNITLPDTVESIGHHAFWANKALTSINLPDGISTIEHQAFEQSGLTSVTIPGSVTSIEDDVFNNCRNLASVIIQEGVTSIGNRAFYNNDSLTSINIPEGVTSVGDSAFDSTEGVTNITIPSTLTDIGEQVFNCFNLNEITISEKLTADIVDGWPETIFSQEKNKIKKINCVKADGLEDGDELACAKALERFILDENGNCLATASCLNNLQKIGNTCVGQYFGSVSGDGTCVHYSTCNSRGNYINIDTRQCVTPANCTGMYVADTTNKKCFKMPGCVDYSNGACQVCDTGYLRQSGACVESSACNGRNYADGDECKEMPSGCSAMSGGRCSSCEGGYLGKDGECIPASQGCGAGYKTENGRCWRTHYTPAEISQLVGESNTILLYYK